MSWQWDSGTVSQLFENSVTICDPNALNSDPGLQFGDHCSKPTETIEHDQANLSTHSHIVTTGTLYRR